jgi:hypothetical protein
MYLSAHSNTGEAWTPTRASRSRKLSGQVRTWVARAFARATQRPVRPTRSWRTRRTRLIKRRVRILRGSPGGDVAVVGMSSGCVTPAVPATVGSGRSVGGERRVELSVVDRRVDVWAEHPRRNSLWLPGGPAEAGGL